MSGDFKQPNVALAYDQFRGDLQAQREWFSAFSSRPIFYSHSVYPEDPRSNLELTIPDVSDSNDIEYTGEVETMFGMYGLQYFNENGTYINESEYKGEITFEGKPRKIYTPRGSKVGDGKEAFGIYYELFTDATVLTASSPELQAQWDERTPTPSIGTFGTPATGHILQSKVNDIVVSKTTQRVKGPQPYKAIRILDSLQPAFPVLPGSNGESATYGSDMTQFMNELGSFFETHDEIGSIVYTLRYVGGQKIGDVLANRLGLWANSSYLYGLFLEDLSWVETEAIFSIQEWPQLSKCDDQYFVDRTVNSESGYYARFNNQLESKGFELQASIAAGVAKGLGGLFQGLGDAGMTVWQINQTQAHDLLMQENAQKFRELMMEDSQKFQAKLAAEKLMLGALAKNWLAEEEFARSISADVGQTQAESSRADMNSQQMAESTPGNPAWLAEQKRPLYNKVPPPALPGFVSGGVKTGSATPAEPPKFGDESAEETEFIEANNPLFVSKNRSSLGSSGPVQPISTAPKKRRTGNQYTYKQLMAQHPMHQVFEEEYIEDEDVDEPGQLLAEEGLPKTGKATYKKLI
ncbi:hypothetical protein 3 [Beihai picorna-like virus 83]|uniref:hypothetical protein 3 n=1 Tax=Beihai picorna-like virus 83 TaxID=1922631 RepID=UPI0009097648|nr:hypothetical protein 3 [Beihai picorna-like virus 83]APG76905.1 hypothetical protein 3 [Beihai picorna-like virus 83]